MEDSRGVTRGACKACGCSQYAPVGGDVRRVGGGTSWKCSSCGHPPAKHRKLSARRTCRFPGCYEAPHFDMNIGEEKPWCLDHEGYAGPTETRTEHRFRTDEVMKVQDIENDDWSYVADATQAVSQQEPLWDHQYAGASPVYVTDGGGAVMLLQPPHYDGQYLTMGGECGVVNQIQGGMMSMTVGGDQPIQCGVPGRQKCAIPECTRPSYVEEDGTVHKCCGKTHAKELEERQTQQKMLQTQQQMVSSQQIQVPMMSSASPAGQLPPHSPPPAPLPIILPSGQRKCAIRECPNPCFTDGAGTVHECCGITHAMEHQRRKAIEQQKQVTKGVTHCLLPECNQLVWPFKNYCGRSHADQGLKRGLQPPAPPSDPNAPKDGVAKDSSLCIIPNCTSKKFTDPSGITHPYCGKSHAEMGKKLNILPTADKQEDQCELPGCKVPKRKEGGRVHDYCCQSHAQQDAPNRDARILTDMTAVRKFLDGFSKLKGYTITENQHAKPGGSLFNTYKQKWNSLPKNQRTTQLAFHGTAERNISSICQNGFDPKLRSGQAYGPGEYFATTPDIPLSYCKGGKKMLLNELLLGQQGKDHTKHGNIIVMKDPAHDLPRFVVTFP